MKHDYTYLYLLFVLCTAPLGLKGQTDGLPDPAFGQSGQVILADPPNSYYGGSTVLLPDGKLVVGTFESDPSGEGGLPVCIRLLPNGSIDHSYGVNGRAYLDIDAGIDGGLRRIATTPDGKLIVLGNILTDTFSTVYMARLDTAGAIDPSFGQDGFIIFHLGNDQAESASLFIKPDGRILFGGILYNQNTPSFLDMLVVQLLPDGAFDPAFGTNGVATANFSTSIESVLSLAIQADGKIVGAGGIYNNNDYAMIVVRFNANGTLDQTFGSNGAVGVDLPGRVDIAYAVAVQDDQKIVFCGVSFEDISTGEITLSRLQPDGSLDPAFGTNGQVNTDLEFLEFARALVLQPDGKILVGAESIASATNGQGRFWLLRYTEDGSLDATFGDNGRVKTPIYADEPETAEVLLQPDGKIIQVGNTDEKIVLWRYLNDPIVSVQEMPDVDFQLTCLPNPVADQAELTWILTEPGDVRCDLYDIQGRLLKTLVPPTFSVAGSYRQTIHIGNAMPAGACFLLFSVGDKRQVLSLSKM